MHAIFDRCMSEVSIIFNHTFNPPAASDSNASFQRKQHNFRRIVRRRSSGFCVPLHIFRARLSCELNRLERLLTSGGGLPLLSEMVKSVVMIISNIHVHAINLVLPTGVESSQQ